jgi:adenylate cyclase
VQTQEADRSVHVADRFGFAGLVLDLGAHSLTDTAGADVPLTPAEFNLLAALVGSAGRALSRDHLMQAMVGRESEAFDRSVDVLVGRLRRKIEPDPKNPKLVVTVPGVGYKFAIQPKPATNARIAELDRPSIAVLPFANLSDDPGQDYFADGMVEEITTALSRVRWFFVIARNSSFTYKGRAVDVKQVGRELGVRYVLEGSVRRAGDRVRITAQLIETETGTHIWADRFDSMIEHIFDMQDEITASVVGAIEPQLRDAELIRAARHRPTDPTAYDCFLRGMARYFSEAHEENEATMRLLRKAIASDPDFAPPYALAAICHVHRVIQGWSENPRADSQLGAEMARTAIRLGSSDPSVLALAGYSLGFLGHEHDLALSLTERALSLNPNSATALQLAGGVRLLAGDPEAAMTYFLRGARLNPIDPKRFILDSGLARACLMLGRNKEAVTWARKSRGSAPHWIFALIPLAGALAMLGSREEAQATVAQFLAHAPHYSMTREISLYKPTPARDTLAAALAMAGFPP